MQEIICREVENDDELQECLAIRQKVFVDEQGLFSVSDRDDHDDGALHIAAVYKDKIIGTVRIYKDKDGIWWGGRLAVSKRFRGRAGRLLVQKAVEIVQSRKADHFKAYVQIENINFFKNLNWKPVGAVFYYHEKPHQLMEAELRPLRQIKTGLTGEED